MNKNYDRDVAILTCRMLRESPYVVVDTETTGLTEPEACQIGWVTYEGKRGLINIKPNKPIEAGAYAIHHISNEMVKDCPTFSDVFAAQVPVLPYTLFYNAPFDTGVIARSLSKEYHPAGSYDIMLIYSSFDGTWDSYHNNYKWWKLGTALTMCHIQINETLHDASVDASMTRELMLFVANQKTSGEIKIINSYRTEEKE
jgi:DNA polymerase III epsilon subunit-like protein